MSKYFEDFDICFEELIKKSTLEDAIYIKDLQLRKMYLHTEIANDTVIDVIHHILQFNHEDADVPPEQRTPILLYLSSNGGSVDAGFSLIDTITCSKTPVYIINTGYQYSMGFLIGLAGHKRFAMPNAKFLMHDGSQFIYNSGAKVQDQMEFNKRQEERIRSYVLARTKITPKLYDKNLRKEWYMFADEAKELGVTDFILGVDCPLDEIV